MDSSGILRSPLRRRWFRHWPADKLGGERPLWLPVSLPSGLADETGPVGGLVAGPGRGVTVESVTGSLHAGHITAGSTTLPHMWRNRIGGPACGPPQRSPQAVSALTNQRRFSVVGVSGEHERVSDGLVPIRRLHSLEVSPGRVPSFGVDIAANQRAD
jgi:hypothetical protein